MSAFRELTLMREVDSKRLSLYSLIPQHLPQIAEVLEQKSILFIPVSPGPRPMPGTQGCQ